MVHLRGEEMLAFHDLVDDLVKRCRTRRRHTQLGSCGTLAGQGNALGVAILAHSTHRKKK